MKVGPIFLIPSPGLRSSFKERYDQVFAKVEHANGRGYEAVWFTEHHFSDYGLSPNPLMMLAHAAHVAPDLRLGSGVVVLPMWHPMRLAEDIALLDVLSGGRVDVGIGRGYQDYEFRAFGADIRRGREMLEESIAIMRQAWTAESFSHDGEFWRVEPTTVLPKPLQEPHPPIWMAAVSPASLRFAVEQGFHLATGTGATLDEMVPRNAYIDHLLDELGRPHDQVERAANRFIFCSTSEDEIALAIKEIRWQLRVSASLAGGPAPPMGLNTPGPDAALPPVEAWQEVLIIGDPDECIRRLQALADAGISYVYGVFDMGGLDADLSMRSMQLFTEEVMPALPAMPAKRLGIDEREIVVARFFDHHRQGL